MAADEALARVIAEQRQHDAQWHYAGIEAQEPPQAAPESSRFVQLLKQMNTLHDQKAADYGDGTRSDNLRAASLLGLSPVLGVLLRLSDKVSRIQTITRTGRIHVAEESMRDTLLDCANYCLLAIILLEEEQDAG